MRFVKEHPQQPVELVLRVLGIASSTYYGWVERARNPSSRRLQDEQLLAEIIDIHTSSGGIYGSPRVHAPWIVDDQLWAVIEPLLPVREPGKPGPARMDDRLPLQVILFVLFTGIGWEDLPQELGFRSGMTCWRRVRDWQKAGVFEAVHESMLAHCHAAGLIDFDRVIPDGSHVRAIRGADTGPSAVDRRKTGSKQHILPCGNGLPLAITLSAANVNDQLVLPELLDKVRPLRGPPGRPRRRITTLIADKGYDYPRVHNELRQRGITATSRAAAPATKSRGDGSSNNPLPCSTNTGAWPPAGNAAPISTTDSSISQPPSSAGDDSGYGSVWRNCRRSGFMDTGGSAGWDEKRDPYACPATDQQQHSARHTCRFQWLVHLEPQTVTVRQRSPTVSLNRAGQPDR